MDQGEQFFLRMVAYLKDKPRNAIGMRLLINTVLEQAYEFARGQDVPDRFKEYGTNQTYWRGRTDAANAVRKLKSKVPSGSEEQGKPHIREPARAPVPPVTEGSGRASRGGGSREGTE